MIGEGGDRRGEMAQAGRVGDDDDLVGPGEIGVGQKLAREGYERGGASDDQAR